MIQRAQLSSSAGIFVVLWEDNGGCCRIFRGEKKKFKKRTVNKGTRKVLYTKEQE